MIRSILVVLIALVLGGCAVYAEPYPYACAPPPPPAGVYVAPPPVVVAPYPYHYGGYWGWRHRG